MRTATEYKNRLEKYYDELKWLYCELYQGRQDMFEQLCQQMEIWYRKRDVRWKKLDREREKNPK